jgi:uncharacterized damage-inducible protein DinB
MELDPATATTYVRLAFRQMRDLVDRLGDEAVNRRPFGANTNTVAALVIHCCGVGEFWLGCVGLGRPSDRDRDAEFTATATVADLHAVIDASEAQLVADIRALDAGEGSGVDRAPADPLEDDDHSDAALVLHVLEELYQHLGHMDLTADALNAAR